MCGIFAYKGNAQCCDIIINGLRRLQYRGSDSSGIGIMSDSIKVCKDVGHIDDIKFDKLEGTIGIGQNRWSTHGSVTKENAHPHLSNNKQIAVVHNGIIDNYKSIKDFLISKGFHFDSETDTEVIPNLIEYHMRRYDYIESVKKTLKHLDGQYALAILGFGKLIGVRKEAPLVVGVGKDEYYISSDVPAFLDLTKDVIYLKENDMVVIDNKLSIFNLTDNIFVKREVNKITWDAGKASKGEYKHFFIKEIMEQAQSIERITTIDSKIFNSVADEINQSETYLVACGTASYATIYALYLFAKVANYHLRVYTASEMNHFYHLLNKKSLVIAVSQSGETADVLDTVRMAKSLGVRVVSIVNVVGSSLMNLSDKIIIQGSGYEIAVPATKTYTSQLAVLYVLAYSLIGKTDEAKNNLKEVYNHIFYLTSENAQTYIKELAKQLRYTEHLYLIGRGLEYATALEAAWKIKEVTYIHAEANMGGEPKHGSIALINYGTPCIVFTSDDNDIINNAIELKSRGAYIIGVGPTNNEVFEYFIKVRDIKYLNPICQIIPIQILSYTLALLRGCNPDLPKNLAKSLTVK